MKRIVLTLTIASLLLMGGCREEAPSTTPAPSLEKPEALEDEAKQTPKVTEPSIEDTDKETYVGTAEKALAAVGRQIDDLAANATELGEEAKAEAAQAIESLIEKKQSVMEKIKALKQDAGKTWTEIKPDLDAAMDDLNNAYKKVKDRLQKDENDDAEPAPGSSKD